MTASRLVLVDDDPHIREVAAMCLAVRDRFRVETADGGAAGVELVRRTLPDAVLLDVMMPGMDGLTAAQHLRSDPSTASIPIVFLTARTAPPDIERMDALGVQGVIAKPFDPSTVADELSTLLGETIPSADSSVNGPDPTMQLELESTWETHRALVDEQVDAMEQAAAAAATGQLTDEVRQKACSAAHQLAGGAGLFGMPELGELCHELEDRLEQHTTPVADELPLALVRQLRAVVATGPSFGT